MGVIDLVIVLGYLTIIVGVGFWAKRGAAKNMRSYFLGSHSLPWWALAMSGSATNFSLMGTMWMCTVLYTLGMKSFWIHWMWALPHGAFLMAFMAIWIRRTRVLTAAELLRFRFGTGSGAVVARTMFAAVAVLVHAGTIGMGYVGLVKFIDVFLPRLNLGISAEAGTIIITLLAASYTLVGGFRSVIVTEVLQTLLLTIVGLLLAGIAYIHIVPAQLQANIPNLRDWTSLAMPWHSAAASYEAFGPISLTYMAIGLLICIGGAGGHYGEQRFLATHTAADAAKAAAAWAALAVPRWLMVSSVALLGMAALPSLNDPEQLMPMVFDAFLPPGLWGIVLAALAASYMSVTSSLINSGAAMAVHDFWQPLFRPDADSRRLIRASYFASALVISVGMIMGVISLRVSSIDGLWRWLMTGLGASYLVPNALRWYWWRMNGWGFAAGCLSGFAVSLLMLVMPWPAYVLTPILLTASIAGCIVGSLLTAPVEPEYLGEFYRRVRPFGIWAPLYQNRLGPKHESMARLFAAPTVLVNLVAGSAAIYGLYMMPIYLVGHWHLRAAACLTVVTGTSLLLYFTWYRRLPQERDATQAWQECSAPIARESALPFQS